MCTIASTPRLPEHCVEYAKVLQWSEEKPFGGRWLSVSKLEQLICATMQLEVRGLIYFYISF